MNTWTPKERLTAAVTAFGYVFIVTPFLFLEWLITFPYWKYRHRNGTPHDLYLAQEKIRMEKEKKQMAVLASIVKMPTPAYEKAISYKESRRGTAPHIDERPSLESVSIIVTVRHKMAVYT